MNYLVIVQLLTWVVFIWCIRNIIKFLVWLKKKCMMRMQAIDLIHEMARVPEGAEVEIDYPDELINQIRNKSLGEDVYSAFVVTFASMMGRVYPEFVDSCRRKKQRN